VASNPELGKESRLGKVTKLPLMALFDGRRVNLMPFEAQRLHLFGNNIATRFLSGIEPKLLASNNERCGDYGCTMG
jgi:hypothetical protein